MEHETIEAPQGAVWAANAFAFMLDKIGDGIDFIYNQFQERCGLDAVTTSEEGSDRCAQRSNI